MSQHPPTLDHMYAAWNELDTSKVRGHLDLALSADVLFIDPSIVTRGIDEFERNVLDFRAKYPKASVARTSGIDAHHNLHRYTWAIQIGGRTVLEGFDVAEVNDAGRVCRVLGFFGPLPTLQAAASAA